MRYNFLKILSNFFLLRTFFRVGPPLSFSSMGGGGILVLFGGIFQKFFQRGEPSSVCHYQGELSLLRADSEVGVIFGPIMASFSQARIFFVKTINIISMYLSAPFVVQHSKISMQQIKSCSHISFLDPNYKRNFDFGS